MPCNVDFKRDRRCRGSHVVTRIRRRNRDRRGGRKLNFEERPMAFARFGTNWMAFDSEFRCDREFVKLLTRRSTSILSQRASRSLKITSRGSTRKPSSAGSKTGPTRSAGRLHEPIPRSKRWPSSAAVSTEHMD